MLTDYQRLIVAPSEESIAGRLLTALVRGWDLVPIAAQSRLLSDTCLIENGKPQVNALPSEVLAFINRHKDGRAKLPHGPERDR